MAKQLLIYENAAPVSRTRHADTSIEPGTGFGFASKVNSVPLMLSEFAEVASELPIVFAGQGLNALPSVLLGVRDDENLLIGPDGKWLGRYIPAFIRRYPFVFSTNADGNTFTLCIDEAFAGANREGRGERLFDDAGEQTQYLRNVLGFVQAYQAQYKQTQSLALRLRQLSLLEPMRASFNLKDGTKFTLTGFEAVNRDRLKQLSPAQAGELFTDGQLELIYLHLHSMRNFNALTERFHARVAAAPQPAIN